MARVSLTFPPSAEMVRTARLVAVASARRAGLAEDRLDEFRLAVGEVCARAVRRCAAVPLAALGPDPRVRLEIEDEAGVILVRVCDPAPEPRQLVPAPTGPADSPPPEGPTEEPEVAEAVVLALVRGLADELRLEPGAGGPDGLVVMTWNPA